MADLDLTEKLGGQPKWVWIVGGVAVATGYFYYRSRKQGTTTTVNTDSSLQDGSSGGTGLATESPYGTPNGIGITSPTPVKSVPMPYSETTAASKPVLRQGATGALVSSLQKELRSYGFNVNNTGIYDRATARAVKSYQTSRGLSTDGVVGTQTWLALTEAKAPVTTHRERPTVAVVRAPRVTRTVTPRVVRPRTVTPTPPPTTTPATPHRTPTRPHQTPRTIAT